MYLAFLAFFSFLSSCFSQNVNFTYADLACAQTDTNTSFALGATVNLCVHFITYDATTETYNAQRAAFPVIVDDFTSLQVQGVQAGLTTQSNFSQIVVQAQSTISSGPLTYFQLANNFYSSAFSLVIQLNMGNITSVIWDHQCATCGSSECYEFINNGTNIDSICNTPSCTTPNTSNCDPQIFVTWIGSDVNNIKMKSAGMRLSRFRQFSTAELLSASTIPAFVPTNTTSNSSNSSTNDTSSTNNTSNGTSEQNTTNTTNPNDQSDSEGNNSTQTPQNNSNSSNGNTEQNNSSTNGTSEQNNSSTNGTAEQNTNPSSGGTNTTTNQTNNEQSDNEGNTTNQASQNNSSNNTSPGQNTSSTTGSNTTSNTTNQTNSTPESNSSTPGQTNATGQQNTTNSTSGNSDQSDGGSGSSGNQPSTTPTSQLFSIPEGSSTNSTLLSSAVDDENNSSGQSSSGGNNGQENSTPTQINT